MTKGMTKPSASSSHDDDGSSSTSIFSSWAILPPTLTILTCCKILLIPSYRSTDFDVHRNWLAITHNLPLSEWYFDSAYGMTVHTLDYPPAFAYFEYLLSNNPLTNFLLKGDFRCRKILGDHENEPSDTCVIFQRSTVIVSDLILFLGAYVAVKGMYPESVNYQVKTFILLVLNPGLLWLDHVHFQYNGMLLGVLLLSLGFLLEGHNVPKLDRSYHRYHLGGAALYALLINLKHLYIPLGPLYFIYLFQHYCIDAHRNFLFSNFCRLAVVTACSLMLPWLPFLLLTPNPTQQFYQILRRLFPFQRGLVHDYWAANVWALYMFLDKLMTRVFSESLPEVPPFLCAMILVNILLVPVTIKSIQRQQIPISDTSLIQGWTKEGLIEAVVYTSLSAFMLAYHVHEKAILTALIPLTLLVYSKQSETYKHLFFHMSVWGLLGLFPLLFQPAELALKIVSYLGYLALCAYFLELPSKPGTRSFTLLLFKASLGMAALVAVVLEVLPIPGRYEFLPLLITSVTCAVALIACWWVSFQLLISL